MEVKLEIRIPPEITWVNMISVVMDDEDIGHINHVVKHIDGDLFLCSVDVFESKKEFVQETIK